MIKCRKPQNNPVIFLCKGFSPILPSEKEDIT